MSRPARCLPGCATVIEEAERLGGERERESISSFHHCGLDPTIR